MKTSHPMSVGTVLLLLFALAVGALLPVRALVRSSNDRQARALGARLRAEVGRASGPRWERRVLRGNPTQGNAADAQFEAVRALSALPADRVRAAFDEVKAGSPVPADIVQTIAAHADAMRSLRETTQRAWAWTTLDLSRGASTPYPQYRQHLVAAKLLIMQALGAPPGECLRAAADVVRLGQDLAPGAGLLGLMVGDAFPAFAEVAVSRCAPRAEAAERIEAARAFAAMAVRAPGVTDPLATDLLVSAVSLHEAASSEPFIPHDVDGMALARDRGVTLDAVEEMLDVSARLRDRRDREHPAAMADARAVLTTLTASQNRMLRVVTFDYTSYLRKDAEARSRVRALAVALRAHAGGEAPGFPVLTDPFTGAALTVEHGPETVTVRGAGFDARQGTPDDVVVALRR